MIPLARRPSGQGGTRSSNHGEHHHKEGHHEGEKEQGNNTNQNVMGASMLVLQEIISRLGPHVEEFEQDHNQEEGSHHLELREEEHECECSHTPLGGRGHCRGGRDRNGEDSINLDIMKSLHQLKPPLYDGKGGGLKEETQLLDMEYCFMMYPYATNMKARCAIMQLRDHSFIWWNIEGQKLQISITDLTWEIFEERV